MFMLTWSEYQTEDNWNPQTFTVCGNMDSICHIYLNYLSIPKKIGRVELFCNHYIVEPGSFGWYKGNITVE